VVSICWALMVMTLAIPAGAMAQTAGPSASQPIRRWDIGGGAALRFGEHVDGVVPHGAWAADVGRYWTPHLKTSIAVMTTGQETWAGGFSDPQSSTGGQRYTVTRPAGFAASMAYQFFDNEFVHPYVTAGARVATTSLSTRAYSTRPPYGLVLISNTPDRLEARPVVGGGFKSYFGNGRAFMRSELVMSIAPHGSANAILMIGAGVDF